MDKILDVYDFSKWTPFINYDVAAKEMNGAIIRCGFRGNKTGKLTMDDNYIKNITELNKRKVPVGIYFFTTAITEAEAREEAVYAIKLAENLNINLSFPIIIDTEYCNKEHNGRSDKLGKTERTNIVLAFINQCHSMGYEAAIYTSESWFTQKLDYSKLKGIKKWVAKYSSSKPTKITDTVIGWQKTDSATLKGIKSNVDQSEWYVPIEKSAAIYIEKKEEVVKEEKQIELKDGQMVTLENCPLYSSSVSNKVVRNISGNYFIWASKKILNRVRITTTKENVGIASKITGWISVDCIK